MNDASSNVELIILKFVFELLSLSENSTSFYNKNRFESFSFEFFFALFSLNEEFFTSKLWIFTRTRWFSMSKMFCTMIENEKNKKKSIKAERTVVNVKSWIVENLKKRNRMIEYVRMMWKCNWKSCSKKKWERMRKLNRNVNCVGK